MVFLLNSMLIISSVLSYDVDSVLDCCPVYCILMFMSVGQEASPSKCVLLSTSKAARRRMIAWCNKKEGCFWGC